MSKGRTIYNGIRRKTVWGMLLMGFVMAVALTAALCSAVYAKAGKDTSDLNGKNWMSKLDDARLITELPS